MDDLFTHSSFSLYWEQLIKGKTDYDATKSIKPQEEYVKEITKVVENNFTKLEKCIKEKTKHIDNRFSYDTTFVCNGFHGLPTPPNYEKPGFETIALIDIDEKYTKLNYMETLIKKIIFLILFEILYIY